MLYTIIDLQEVLADLNSFNDSICTKQIGTAFLECQKDRSGDRIRRIISTDPNDYLKSDLQPGEYYKNPLR